MMTLQEKCTVLLLIATGYSVVSQSYPACITPTEKNGFCVPIERCQNIYNIENYSTSPPSQGIRNYIKKAACSLPEARRSVCCQPEEILPRSTRKLIQRNSNLLPTDTCGKIAWVDRIALGTKTFPFQYPWMVMLWYKLNDTWLIDDCGGSLINNRYVLTAGHCVKTKSSVKLVKLRLGEYDKSTARSCFVNMEGDEHCAESYDVDIEETIVHEDFGQPKYRHDIALIRMAKKIIFSGSVRPICLPMDASVRSQELSKLITTGWGMTENRTVSQVLLQVSVSHVSVSECQQRMNDRLLFISLAESWQMCAIGDNFTDVCKGYSGGPLGNSVSVNGDSKFVQFGIVSAGGQSCGQYSAPVVYTRVSSYMSWILANIRP